ncbi:rhodanese-like domain-containing protein [Frateuria aurantia]
MTNPVLLTPAAASDEALRHFSSKLHFETDCWDVHAALATGKPGFVLLDVRSAELYAQGHIPEATHLTHGKIVHGKLSSYPYDTLFVVYCAGPHCNGADKAAARLAALGRPVKLMIGGITGWLDEGFTLARHEAAAS